MTKKMTKKKIVDMVAYTTLLVHNNAIKDVIDDKQIDDMMEALMESFGNSEEKAVRFITDKVKKLLADLEYDLRNE